ncbi:hypothetical protein Glove_320g124 [Diversispora epigaea]|uniref:Uncharacterized protein n=1 Tax=Diversispora epigaea TaxID=1348612 RepID=A0A397HPA7_9GLOM|nr:hypothetical protein Glove_320g124 [Diversispora epigaea]
MFILNLTKSFKYLFINSTLNNSYIIRYTTQVNFEKPFFNRKQELINFKNIFSTHPKLNIVLGPPGTGKIALIREVISKNNFYPLEIDLFGYDIHNEIYNSISEPFNTFFIKYMDQFKKLLTQEEINFINMKFKLSNERKKISNDDVIELFDDIGNTLPKWTFWNNYNLSPPILIISNADILIQFGNFENNHNFLLSILKNIKKERFHVVFISSGSLFFNQIINILNTSYETSYITPYIIGDLSKEEAKDYFETHALPKYNCKELKGKFDHVYKITGTRIMIINTYIEEYINSEGMLKDYEFSLFRSEYCRLHYRFYTPPYKSDSPLWEKSHLIKTMEALVKAKDQGFILEDNLIETIGFEEVNSLLNYNLLHRRPTPQFSYDIINPPNKVILTAMSKPSLCAMESNRKLAKMYKHQRKRNYQIEKLHINDNEFRTCFVGFYQRNTRNDNEIN